jgi:myo-inositol-1(or 4)-monophosphatase
MQEPDLDQLLAAAVEVARTAGRFALDNKHRRKETLQLLEHDIKLKMDVETQQRAEQTLARIFPDHAVLGEEGSSPQQDAEFEWIIDPIDGTLNYSNDLLIWCSSIAVRHRGKVLAGCVYAPEIDECYTAHADGAARCNGEPIQPSGVARLSEAFLFTGLTKTLHREDPAMRLFEEIALACHRNRICGSAALDLCNVARGRGDGFIEADIYIWDTAAAGLVAERAGARTEVLENWSEHGQRYLCTNGRIHEELKQLYQKVYA